MLTVAYLMLQLLDNGETLPFGGYDRPILETYLMVFYGTVHYLPGTAVAQWLRCCAKNRKVAGSIPDGVIGIFH